ncbi:2-phospho-L-lactate guanylyltransferase [Aeromicrobium sp. HA]|uniref:2-phospho-L-lactate guanylyltransferase n=1 Tax=Aeromicrobium sp. HA TaxID=3009077 RepID=UPI0022AF357F|nr:2-phospho-L-lactate guanylyltransferase [Aeromicrobium sp. HA]
MTGWTVVVPLKPPRLGKSRLQVPVRLRQSLAEAFALDTLAAVHECALVSDVVLVTADAAVSSRVAPRAGWTVLEDRPLLSRGGQNAAIGIGIAWARARRADSPLAVVSADLPCLTTSVLTDVLGRAHVEAPTFVADAEGDGTTMLMAPTPVALRPAFGAGSAHRHSRLGYEKLLEVDVRVRRDVDTVAHLAEARALGLGAKSTAAWEDHISTRAAKPAKADQ